MESSEDKVDLALQVQQLNKLERELKPAATASVSAIETKKECGSKKDKDKDKDDAIIKHLKDIKRQNFMTQCLVSAMIVLTVAWQLSEVSLVLKVKNRITHPFKSFKDLFGKGPPNWKIGQDGDKQKLSSTDQCQNDGTLVPTIKLPDLPTLGLDSDHK